MARLRKTRRGKGRRPFWTLNSVRDLDRRFHTSPSKSSVLRVALFLLFFSCHSVFVSVSGDHCCKNDDSDMKQHNPYILPPSQLGISHLSEQQRNRPACRQQAVQSQPLMKYQTTQSIQRQSFYYLSISQKSYGHSYICYIVQHNEHGEHTDTMADKLR